VLTTQRDNRQQRRCRSADEGVVQQTSGESQSQHSPEKAPTHVVVLPEFLVQSA
jgi:hypothetical protein